jgi:hypothetical protein
MGPETSSGWRRSFRGADAVREMLGPFSTSIVGASVIGSLLCCAAPVAAEGQVPSSSEVPGLILPSGSIPTEIFGVACIPKAGDANFVPSLRCFSREPTKLPSISVSVRDSACTATQAEMIDRERTWMNDGTPFFKVVWERAFNPLTVDNGIGFKGFYQRSMGNRYVWATCGGGKLTQILVIMMAPIDNEALKAEVELKVFGVGQPAANGKDSQR